MLVKAFEIAIKAHKEQKDKAGRPYIEHLVRVSEMGKNETEKICGLLHDLIEDTDWTFQQLKKEGFSEEILNVLDFLTKKDNEDYNDFIRRISKNRTAINIKINDLKDNMDITRLNELKEGDIKRLNKYLDAYHFLNTL